MITNEIVNFGLVLKRGELTSLAHIKNNAVLVEKSIIGSTYAYAALDFSSITTQMGRIGEMAPDPPLIFHASD